MKEQAEKMEKIIKTESRLRVSEIFYSIQGESRTIGVPTTFVRLTGCPLRCTYCDTQYAFQGGKWMTLDGISDVVHSYNTPYVTITGGEPLAQPACEDLIEQLSNARFNVAVETSGALDVSAIDSRASIVMDLKTPGSGEVERNLLANFAKLGQKDQIKIVLCHYEDYCWAKSIVKQHQLTKICEVIFSPSYHQLDPAHLAQWILDDQLQVRLQVQLHKILWGEEQGK